MEIPLKNNKGEIVDYAIVSEEDFEHLDKFKWCKNNDGYVVGKINRKSYRIHRYIMIIILGIELTHKQLVDHINNNKLDNTRDNLRVVTNSENSRNRQKQKNASSKYIGVCFAKDKNKWQTNIQINGKSLYAVYDNEIDAAWHYNLMVDKFDLKFSKKNNIEKPEDFVLYQTKSKKEDLPKHIDKQHDKFRVRLNNIYVGSYNDLNTAILELEKTKIKNHQENMNKLLLIPILYNKNGQCIFKIKQTEVIIDKDLYYDIIKYKWNIAQQQYIQKTENRKTITLHRYIMNYIGNNVVDYIDGNKLNNKLENLRIINRTQNAMNKTKSIGTSSKYIGVSLGTRDGKWNSGIQINGIQKHLGCFENEIDAAKARDQATKKYFGEYGKLNFPEVEISSSNSVPIKNESGGSN